MNFCVRDEPGRKTGGNEKTGKRGAQLAVQPVCPFFRSFLDLYAANAA